MSDLAPNDPASDVQRMNHVSLALRQREPIRNLPGFRKNAHRVPDEVNASSRAFVAKLAANLMQSDLDKVFRELRAAFRFKRTEIQTTEWGDGSGTILTPYFRYGSKVELDPHDATEAIWLRDLSGITHPQQLLTDSFAKVFGLLFDTVEFAPPARIDLELMIDRIEGLDDERVTIMYDRQITRCEISLAEMTAKVEVTPDALRIVHARAQPPRVLVESFFATQNALLDLS